MPLGYRHAEIQASTAWVLEVGSMEPLKLGVVHHLVLWTNDYLSTHNDEPAMI